MKSRSWFGKWQAGKLNDASTPFGRPFYVGQQVNLRECDLGWAVFVEGECPQVRYLDGFQVKDGIDDCKDNPAGDALNIRFDLVREEIENGEVNEEPVQIIGETNVPKGLPLVYNGAVVHCATSLSFLSEPVWMGCWFFDPMGRPHIALEKQVAYAAVGMRDLDFLRTTLAHEAFELREARRQAKADYEKIEPAMCNALCWQFGGLAHAKAVRVVEGYQSERTYDQYLTKWVNKAHLANPPLKSELN